MTTKVVTFSPTMALHEASCSLVEVGITGAPVIENGKVIGMLSQTDLLYKAAGKASIPITTAGAATMRYAANTRKMRKALAGDCRDAMSVDVIEISESATIQEAAALLLKHRVSRLPVVDASKSLVGIISTTDVMQLVVSDPDGCGLSLDALDDM